MGRKKAEQETQEQEQDSISLLIEAVNGLNKGMGVISERLTALEMPEAGSEAKSGKRVSTANKRTNGKRPVGGYDVKFDKVPATNAPTTARGAAKVEHWTRMGRFERIQRYESEAVMPGNAEYAKNVLAHCFTAKGTIKPEVIKGKAKAS